MASAGFISAAWTTRRTFTMDYSVWLVLLMGVLPSMLWISPASADWDQLCPKSCKCTYVSNRKVAECRSAGFSTIPTTLSPEIQELHLEQNRIEYLEKDAFKKAGLVNLQKLYLADNSIRSVHKDAFRDLKILISLDLKGNRIDKLHPQTFTGMEKLRFLYLNSNKLRRLEGGQFPVLPHLRKLIFTDNEISYVNNHAFTKLPLLESVGLSDNRLKLLQPELFLNNTKLVELQLDGNPWECDCRLKSFVRWVKQKSFLQEHVTCHSPERVSKRKLENIVDNELACRPELILSQTEVPVVPGQNASLTCRAQGDPLPNIKWVLHGRVLTNMSVIPFSQPEQRYVLNEVVEGRERWSQLTIANVADHDLTFYTCVADNLAGLVEQNVSLIAAAPTTTGAVSPRSTLDLYIIIAIATGSVILLILLVTLIFCCLRRRKRREPKSHTKVNGNAGGNHIEHPNVMIANPVAKPPRNYSKVPQTDIEITPINSDVGAHTSYDEVDYPETGHLSHRKPLPVLEEEVDDDLPSQDTTLPLESTSHSIIADYIGHYPDLLDITRPRAVSPTQLSYHSLMAPQFTTPGEWRYSCVHPAEYSQYPVAYVAPQVQPRPGYVTLPRRHRSPSWAGQPSAEQESLIISQDDGKPIPYDATVYDTLGPRTTADGTSRTDLTRPTLHAAEPYTPHTPQTPSSPPSLPPYYSPINSSQNATPFQQRNHSSTLPRSTPNLLDNSEGLSLPYHDPSHIPVASCSPTPSNASTVQSVSPAYKSAVNQPHLNKGGFPSKSSSSKNDMTINGLPHNNNLSNKSDANISEANPSSTVLTSGKKVPPKPPPKPSSKRLSVSSTGDSRKSSVVGESGRVFQDEGPDGTEV